MFEGYNRLMETLLTKQQATICVSPPPKLTKPKTTVHLADKPPLCHEPALGSDKIWETTPRFQLIKRVYGAN